MTVVLEYLDLQKDLLEKPMHLTAMTQTKLHNHNHPYSKFIKLRPVP